VGYVAFASLGFAIAGGAALPLLLLLCLACHFVTVLFWLGCAFDLY
jgi:hypothetical protein